MGRKRIDGDKHPVTIDKKDKEKLMLKVKKKNNNNEVPVTVAIRTAIENYINSDELDVSKIIINDLDLRESIDYNSSHAHFGNYNVLKNEESFSPFIKCKKITQLINDTFIINLYMDNWSNILDYINNNFRYNENFLDDFHSKFNNKFLSFFYPDIYEKYYNTIYNLVLKKRSLDNFRKDYTPNVTPSFNLEKELEPLNFKEIKILREKSKIIECKYFDSILSSLKKDSSEKINLIDNIKFEIMKIENINSKCNDRFKYELDSKKITLEFYNSSLLNLSKERELYRKAFDKCNNERKKKQNFIFNKNLLDERKNIFYNDKLSLANFIYLIDNQILKLSRYENNTNYSDELRLFIMDIILFMKEQSYYEEIFEKLYEIKKNLSKLKDEMSLNIRDLLNKINALLKIDILKMNKNERENILKTLDDSDRMVISVINKIEKYLYLNEDSNFNRENFSFNFDEYLSESLLHNQLLLQIMIYSKNISEKDNDDLIRIFSDIHQLNKKYSIILDKINFISNLDKVLLTTLKNSNEIKKHFEYLHVIFDEKNEKDRSISIKDNDIKKKRLEKDIVLLIKDVKEVYKLFPEVEFKVKSQSYLVINEKKYKK